MSIDSDWIMEFLNTPDEELDEANKLPVAKSKSSISMAALKGVDLDNDNDDDCVVLDGDPEKENLLTTSVNGSPTGSSDDLVVVGEMGPIACRDYPHPRHHCANFPYSSTPHQRYCGQCHCYVCDSPAPCLMWGTGISSTDHCHATDKSHMWKTLRKNFKLGIKTSPLLSASTNHGVGNSQHNHIQPLNITNSMSMNQVPQQTIMRVSPLPNYSLQNQFSGPKNVPVCSTASNFTMLHGANHGRSQESGGNGYQSHSIRRQFLGVQNPAIQEVQGQGTLGLGPQFLNPNMMSNSLGSQLLDPSTLSMNHFTHGASGFSHHVNPGWQYDGYCAPTGFSNSRTCYGHNDVLIPKANTSLRYGSHYSSMSYQAQLAYSIQGNDALSSYMAGLNRNEHLSEHQIGIHNENAHHATMQYASQGKPLYGNQSEYVRNTGFQALDSSWGVNSNQNIPHLQSFGSINMPLNAKESGIQSTAESSHFSLDDINNWLVDEPS